jgi:hypothetical protein
MADSKYKPLVQDEVPQAVGVVNSQPLFVPPVVETIPTDTFTNHMSLALYTCIFCCWPLGMVAMAYSHMASQSYESGNFLEGRHLAFISKRLSIVGIVFGVLSLIAAITAYTVLMN